MTSKDLCRNVSINVKTGLANINAETYLEIKKSLEVLDYIKLLVSNYNNGKLGYINFTQEVIEVVINDK